MCQEGVYDIKPTVLQFLKLIFGLAFWPGIIFGQNTMKVDNSKLLELRSKTIASLEAAFGICDHKAKTKSWIEHLKRVPDEQFPIEYIKLLKSISEEKTYKEIKCLVEAYTEIRFDIHVIENSQENIEKYLIPFFVNREVSRSFSKLPLEYMRSGIVAALGRSFPKNDPERKKYLMIALKELKKTREESIGFFIAGGEDKLLKSIGEELSIKIHDYVKVAERPYANTGCGPGRIHDVYVPMEFATKFSKDERCEMALELFRLHYGEEGQGLLDTEPYFWRNKKKIANFVSSEAFSKNFSKAIKPKDIKDYIDYMNDVKRDYPESVYFLKYEVWNVCSSKYKAIVDKREVSCY